MIVNFRTHLLSFPNNIFLPYFPDAHLSDKSLGLRGWKPRPRQTPRPGDGEWGRKDGWFSEARLLAATEDLSRHSLWRRRKPLFTETEDECESTKALTFQQLLDAVILDHQSSIDVQSLGCLADVVGIELSFPPEKS